MPEYNQCVADRLGQAAGLAEPLRDLLDAYITAFEQPHGVRFLLLREVWPGGLPLSSHIGLLHHAVQSDCGKPDHFHSGEAQARGSTDGKPNPHAAAIRNFHNLRSERRLTPVLVGVTCGQCGAELSAHVPRRRGRVSDAFAFCPHCGEWHAIAIHHVVAMASPRASIPAAPRTSDSSAGPTRAPRATVQYAGPKAMRFLDVPAAQRETPMMVRVDAPSDRDHGRCAIVLEWDRYDKAPSAWVRILVGNTKRYLQADQLRVT